MAQFSGEEYVDIHFVYGFCDGNASRARNEYQSRFPTRRVPDPRVFTNIHRRLRDIVTASITRAEPHSVSPNHLDVDEEIIRNVTANPSISIRRLALQLNVSRYRIHQVLHKENLHPYHITPVQELLPIDHNKRLEFCNLLMERNLDNDSFVKRILWTDESQFTRDGITNFHNLHTWAAENPHSKKQTSFQHRFSVNVWAGVIGDMLIGPFILPPRLNGEFYLQFLQNDLPLLLDDVPILSRISHTYQQDGAPCHYDRNVTNWLNENYPNNWIGRNGPIHWPARSPDLTVLDFYVWGTMKAFVYSKEIETKQELIQRIYAAAQQIREELPRIEITKGILKRILACIQSQGGHFEHFL